MNRQETLALLKRIKTVLKHSRHIWVTAISESRLYLPTTFSSYLIMSNVFSRSRAEKKTLPFVHKHTFLHNILQCDLKTFLIFQPGRVYWHVTEELSESWQFPLPSSNLLFAAIECGIYQISICTMISLFMLRNLPLDLLIEFLPLPCYVEQAK